MRDTPIWNIECANLNDEKYIDFIEDVLGSTPIATPNKGCRYPKDRTTKKQIKYLDIVTAFDIETSKEKYGEEPTDWRAWMYIWQWQFGDRYTIIGRSWESFLKLVHWINVYLEAEDARLMVYVHNLSYEFQFLSGVWNFEPTDLFATDVRSPLYCKMGNIELRCSYMLSNYGLARWAIECNADHRKLEGNLDYDIVRYPWTEITDEELAYCVNDVMAVVECVTVMLHSYGDTLYSIPYTNTGYIRRRVKKALRMWSPQAVKEMCGDLEIYDRLRYAFRGGNTHANRWHVRDILGDVYSYDRSSSYPDVICHCKFPMSAFRNEREEDCTMERYQKLIDSGKAVLLKIGLYNVTLKKDRIGLPYIPADKCCMDGYRFPVNPKLDNGRILGADYLEIAVTDIDFEIIQKQYKWDGIEIHWMMSARYGYLPKPLVDIVVQLYKAKTALKGVEGSEVTYAHAKAELNSIYGMMVQRVITNPIVYSDGHWSIGEFDRDGDYKEAVSHAFVCYQWGVWVTAWARYRLQEGIELAEKLYPDDPLSSFRVR